jgi:UDPglucose 6-dehydrogenase
MIIKSTIPIGLTKKLSEKYQTSKLFFSPEFLREGRALYDNLYPSRIIVGGKTKEAEIFAKLMVEGAIKDHIDVLFVGSTEAEAIKLFSNTYLAMRVAFFNELDSFAEKNELDSSVFINGVSLDSRIGNYYNNPSFGYGGYCLPKDTKQLLSEFKNTPQSLINAIINSNSQRKNFIVSRIMSMNIRVVGAYKLGMKKSSDNYRDSAIISILKSLSDNKIKLLVYEPDLVIYEPEFYEIIDDFDEFIEKSELIISNRYDDRLREVKHKLYTRDLYNKD